MKIRKKTLLNLLLILFVAAFFVTPLGYYGKVILIRIFAKSPEIIQVDQRVRIEDYSWRLKDESWEIFNFDRSRSKVIFINFWASWHLPSEAELNGIQKLYEDYSDRVDFYLITNQEQEPVETFMQKHEFSFPVTYLIIGDKSAVEVKKPAATYILDRQGSIVVDHQGVGKWNSDKVRETLDLLLVD